jgi:uncharacterized protein (TIGR00290 family)
MHGVRVALLAAQARALGVPLAVAPIPPDATNDIYQARMEAAFAPYRERGVTRIAFGDLFLADIRRYREAWLAGAGMTPLFPLWLRDTRALAHECVESGMRAILTCVDTRVLPPSFAGRDYDRRLLADLPAGIDPCGENGEFHTFVVEAPIFREAIPVRRGETVQRAAWCFCDLLPAGPAADPPAASGPR